MINVLKFGWLIIVLLHGKIELLTWKIPACHVYRNYHASTFWLTFGSMSQVFSVHCCILR